MVKIVACSDSLSINTSYALQMEMLMQDIPCQWHYVENGVMVGKQHIHQYMDYVEIYPGRNKDNSASPEEVFRITTEEDADLMFLYEDVQHLLKYAAMTPIPYPAICWFPHDSEAWIKTLPTLIEACKDRNFLPICISKNTQELFAERGYDVKQIYNIVDTAEFHPLKPEDIERFKKEYLEHMAIDPNKKVLLYVGRMTPRKNIESLLHAAKLLSVKRDDFVLIIHGDVNDPGRSCDPKMEVITRNLDKHVILNSINYDQGVPKSFLNYFYNMADIYVSTAGGEGFGLPICEAGACGTPFVAMDYTTGREFSKNAMHGLLYPPHDTYARPVENLLRPIPNVGEMVKALDYLLDDENTRDKMGTDFMEWVHDNCSRRVIAGEFAKLFKTFTCKEAFINES